MIQKVEIENFKSHKNTKLDFSNLTVLCGTNSSGKSSVIQALILLKDSHSNKFEFIDLKSKNVFVGTAKDALYQFAQEDKISFRIDSDNQELHFVSKIKDLGKTILPIETNNANFSVESLFQNSCQFISAFRLGPQKSYSKNDKVEFFNQISEFEGKAENTVQFLNNKKNNIVFSELCIKDYDSFLIDQVSAWENEISKGIKVLIDDKTTDFELNYQFGETKSNAINIGFGLTYVLPVIVAILSAPKDAIIFIENPEAHLHPKGQAKLAELICLAAQAGVQIVIETHSDHIFNGVRKAINKKMIAKENLKVHYFDLGDKNISTNKEIKFTDNGRILDYTEGLFDQFDNDLDELLGL